MVKLLTEVVRAGVHQRFHAAESRRIFDANDVSAGRAYVEAYVPYVHCVERLWQDAQGGGAHGHYAQGHEVRAH